MAGYIGSKTSVAQVDGYTRTEADAGFVSDPNGAVTVDGSGNVGIGTSSPANLGGYVNLTLDDTAGSFTEYRQAGASKFRVGSDSSLGGFLNQTTADPIRFLTNSTERMRIDSAGRVTTPYQPMFHALRTTHITTSGDIVFQQVNRNVGGHYSASNGRFTAPIAGNYLFCFSTLLYTLGYSTNVRLQLNGGGFYGMSSIGTYGQHTGAYSGQGGSTIVYLNAGDYVAVNVSYAGTNLHAGYTFWSGQLVG